MSTSTPRRPRGRRALLAAAVAAGAAALAMAGTSAPLAAAAPAAPSAPAATVTTTAAASTFSSDFTGPKGSAVDKAKWRFATGGTGNGNHEKQFYTSGTDNAALDGNGHLVITAKKAGAGSHNCWYGQCQYTSAKLITKATFTQAHGHFAARMKLPHGQGMWPAFWLLGANEASAPWPNCGEIDIMENIGREPGTVHGTIHGPGYSGANGPTGSYTLPGGKHFSEGFHTFAVDWSPNAIVWSVDGKTYERRTPAAAQGNKWVFNHPFYIIMNLAVGGDWPGDPDGSTNFPQQLVVDYVHVTAN